MSYFSNQYTPKLQTNTFLIQKIPNNIHKYSIQLEKETDSKFLLESILDELCTILRAKNDSNEIADVCQMVLNRCFKTFSLSYFNKAYFDLNNPVTHTQLKLQIFQGYTHKILSSDLGLLLTIDLAFQPIRPIFVFKELWTKSIFKKMQKQTFSKFSRKEIASEKNRLNTNNKNKNNTTEKKKEIKIINLIDDKNNNGKKIQNPIENNAKINEKKRN
ncbi:piwi-like protein [Anaeramoeba flamelloides]|uniref:Piwi-like protein n=1 Tax=Anaeramoeba flamelloides TaxID=1746091 RepID=A0ABQ8XDJ0_9EUKA|nr:piwi-like protein [Anaeramoeba flamelloides]